MPSLPIFTGDPKIPRSPLFPVGPLFPLRPRDPLSPFGPGSREGLGDSYRHLNDRVEGLPMIIICLSSELLPCLPWRSAHWLRACSYGA